MTIDYSKIKKKLNPKPDGEDVLRLRVGVVTAVNSDGTLDVTISGVTVTGVYRLSDSPVTVGAIVQILSYRGSLLAIGPTATGAESGGIGLWTRAYAAGNSSTITTSFTSTGLVTPTVTFVKNRVYEVRTHGGVQSSATGYADLRVYRSAAATQLGEFFRYPITVANVAMNASGSGFYFTTSVDVSGSVTLYASFSAGNGVHVGTSNGTPRNIEVWDVGDTSRFPGINTW